MMATPGGEIVAIGGGGFTTEPGNPLHFVGRELVGAVGSRPRARAYRVEPRDGQVVEEAVPTRFLGALAAS